MDPSMFVTYTPQTNGVPSESKLATYMVIHLFFFALMVIRLSWIIIQCRLIQNHQSPGIGLSTSSMTKHLSNLSLDSQKKVTASPEFVPGRGLTGSNSSSPNLFNNSYTHSQENVGGTTYFYFGNTSSDAVVAEDGTEAVSTSFDLLYCLFYPLNKTDKILASFFYL